MAKQTPSRRKSKSKKKAASRKKPAARSAGSKKKTTKKKTTRKKTSRGKPASSKRSATRKTKTKKKAATRPAKKKTKTSKKKAPARKTKKKATSKKKAPARKTKKKVAARKPAPKKKKKTPSKKSSAKKTSSKPVGGKKTTSKSKAGGASGAGAKTKKKKKKKSGRASSGRRGSGRSVAEVASTTAADAQGYVFINGRRIRMISTKGHIAAKKPRTSSRSAAPVIEAPKPPKPVKTKLTRKELNYYRNILLLKRAELVGDLSAMEAEALRSGGDNLSHMPIHMADIGTDTFDQDFMLGLAENERKRLREIDEALMRIQDGTYGVCMMTAKPIPKTRLEAKPWAKYSIEAARQLEGGWTT